MTVNLESVASQRGFETLFFKAAKGDRQLSQIISIGTNRQPARAPERICRLLSDRRNDRI
jgi:hypothetical protein